MYVYMYVYVCALQSQGFDELLAKLNAAVQVLQNSEVQLGTDVTEQVPLNSLLKRACANALEYAPTPTEEVDACAHMSLNRR